MKLTQSDIVLDLTAREARVQNRETCAAVGLPVDMAPAELFYRMTNNATGQHFPMLDEATLEGLMVGGESETPSEPSLWSKITSAWSAITGPHCSDAEYAARLAICGQCDRRAVAGQKSYCDACGCGTWIMAELSTKLRFASLRCPLEKWGPVVL